MEVPAVKQGEKRVWFVRTHVEKTFAHEAHTPLVSSAPPWEGLGSQAWVLTVSGLGVNRVSGGHFLPQHKPSPC